MGHKDIDKLFEELGLKNLRSRANQDQELGKKLEEAVKGTAAGRTVAQLTLTKTPTFVKVEGKASPVTLVQMVQAMDETCKMSTGHGILDIVVGLQALDALLIPLGLDVKDERAAAILLDFLDHKEDKK